MVNISRNLLFVAILLNSVSVAAQDQKSQTWYGVLDAGPTKLRLQMEFTQDEEGKFSGHMISLDQNNTKVVCDEVNLDDRELSFSLKLVGAKFSGKLNKARDEVTGTFAQGGVQIPFTLKKVDKIPTRTLVQTWTGKMKAGAQEFDFQFRVFEDDDGAKAVVLDSFTELLSGIPCTFKHNDDQITIDIPIQAAPATFVGKLNEDESIIVGSWQQQGQEYDLVLTSVPISSTRKIGQNRPQTPKPPFDYDSEDLRVENKKDALTLAGTLTTPKGDGPFPVVVMITGSGPQDRDETIFGHKLFFVIADHFAKHGIAVFRFDDRGVAESTGDFGTATSADFANDVDAVVNFLKTHNRVAGDKIVLCGHSEGGIIAPMVASRRQDIAGIILMAGTGVTGREISVNQSRLMAESAGSPDHIVKLNETMLMGLYDRQEAGDPLDDEYLDALAAKMKLDLPVEMRDSLDTRALITTTMRIIQSDWFRFFATYDPVPALQKTSCPVLGIFGEKDTQVDPKLNMPPIEQALKDGGNPDFELHTLPNLNHLFQNCRTGSLAEYSLIEETISPDALGMMVGWLKKRFIESKVPAK